MDIFIICTVRGATPEYKKELEDYVVELEEAGHNVHLPHRDTKQDARSIDICKENAEAIYKVHEVHIFYNELSQGTHFDMGVAFAFGKRIKIIKNEEIVPHGKSFPRMLIEWETNSNSHWHWHFFDFVPEVKNQKMRQEPIPDETTEDIFDSLYFEMGNRPEKNPEDEPVVNLGEWVDIINNESEKKKKK